MGHEVPGAPDTEARRAPDLHEHRGDGVSEGRHQRLVVRQHHAGRAQPDGRRALGGDRQDHRRRPRAPLRARDPELVEPELLGTDHPREDAVGSGAVGFVDPGALPVQQGHSRVRVHLDGCPSVVRGGPFQHPPASAAPGGQGRKAMALDVGGLVDVPVVVAHVAPVDPAHGTT